VACLALLASLTSLCAQIVDDFSGGDWKQFTNTPGTMTVAPGKLYLKDSPEAPDWITASKVFRVNVDQTPVFAVEVTDVSDAGTVKLIRQKPYDKRVALQIDQPGLYAVNLAKEFGWKGEMDIETCLYALGDEEDITYSFAKYVAALTPDEETRTKERASLGNVRLNVAAFEMVPLFNACGYYFRSPERPGLAVSYREKGGAWQPAFAPPYMAADKMYRGSVVDLAEDTSYELRIADGEGKTLAQDEFRTWRSTVPIGKTIVLDETNFDGHLRIRESGRADGWLRITAKPGFILRNDRAAPLLELSKKSYIVLENMVLRGGNDAAISIKKCANVRVMNCDIADWGRFGIQRFDLDGKYYTDNGRAINWDSAILLSRSKGVVIERCYIHDPVSTANSWYYSHPAGPQAVGIDKPQSTVIRYNDFIGSDLHRWNDSMEGAGNFSVDGGFNRDADIYGNMVCFSNDDSIEIDGGQTNVRVFDNKFEGCLCATSIQGCMSSPSYVFRNLMVNMGDEQGLAGQTIKTSSHANGPDAVSFIFNNTCYGESGDLSLRRNLRIVAKNNIFAGRRAIAGRTTSPQSECDYNLLSTGEPGDEPHGILAKPDFVDPAAGLFALRENSPAIGKGTAIANFAPGQDGRVDMGAIPFGTKDIFPVRPLPVYPNRHQLGFSPKETKAGGSQTIRVAVRGEGFAGSYRIAQNTAFDWFSVSPASGTLASGKTATFTVTVDPSRMTKRALYKGAFLIRMANGLSRPIMVYAKTDYVQAVKPTREGVWVQYIEAETPTGGKAYEPVSDPKASGGRCIELAGESGKGATEYRFTVPKDQPYYVILRAKSPEADAGHDSIFFAMDKGKLERSKLRIGTDWGWTMAAQNRKMSLICLQPFKLKAGDHVLKIAPRISLQLDLVAITDNPKMFE
jgi:hypothetical protein